MPTEAGPSPELLLEAGKVLDDVLDSNVRGWRLQRILAFAVRVRDEERERCAQIAEPTWAAAAIRGEAERDRPGEDTP